MAQEAPGRSQGGSGRPQVRPQGDPRSGAREAQEAQEAPREAREAPGGPRRLQGGAREARRHGGDLS